MEFELRREIRRLQEYRKAGIKSFCSESDLTFSLLCSAKLESFHRKCLRIPVFSFSQALYFEFGSKLFSLFAAAQCIMCLASFWMCGTNSHTKISHDFGSKKQKCPQFRLLLRNLMCKTIFSSHYTSLWCLCLLVCLRPRLGAKVYERVKRMREDERRKRTMLCDVLQYIQDGRACQQWLSKQAALWDSKLPACWHSVSLRSSETPDLCS